MNICLIVFSVASLKYFKKLRKKYLDSNITVLSITPGVNLEVFNDRNTHCIPYESYADSVSELKISEDSAKIIKCWVDSIDATASLVTVNAKSTINLAASLQNMSALYLSSLIRAVYALESHFSKNDYNQVYFFSSAFDLILPERNDISFLYYPELIFGPICRDFLKLKHVSFFEVYVFSSRFKRLKNRLRSFLISSYKFSVTLYRCFRDRSRCNKDTLKLFSNVSKKARILILIRAVSEWDTVSSLYHYLKGSKDFEPLILQDDLLKRPSGFLSLSKANVPFVPIHCRRPFFRLIKLWFSSFSVLSSYKKKSLHLQSQLKKLNYACHLPILNQLNLSLIASESVYVSLLSVMELHNFTEEIDFWLNFTKPKAVITMDMVDQWCAVLYSLNKQNHIKTFILQNTCLDKIVYPLPVCADKMWLHSNAALEIMKESGERYLGKYQVVGSPMYDNLYNQLNSVDRQALRLKYGARDQDFVILIATQAFSQAYPYNKHLLRDVSRALSGIHKNLFVIVKPHPREPKGEYKKLIDCFQCRAVVYDNVDITELMFMSDLFISRTSTAIQTALLVGLQSISYLQAYPLDICQRLDYLGAGATRVVDNRDDLSSLLYSIIQDEGGGGAPFLSLRQAYINSVLGVFDGNSVERIVNDLDRSLGGGI